MKIEKIVKLDHPGVLHDFSWPRDLSPFSRYNLVYGWNGTGKSTISGLFQQLGRGTVPKFETTLVIDGQNLHSQDFGLAARAVRVFNRDFIDRNVFHADGADLPLILTLGEKSAERQKELALLRTRIESETVAARDAAKSLRLAKKDRDDHCKNRAKDIKDLLTSEGNNPYRLYDKRDYEKAAKLVAADQDPSRFSMSEATVKSDRAIHTASSRSTLQVLTFSLPDLADHVSRVNSLLARTATSQVIEDLRSQPEVADWVQRGVELHDARGAEQCLYCDQKLPSDRIASLKLHFDNALLQLQSQIRAAKHEIEAERTRVASLKVIDSARLHEALTQEWETAVEDFQEEKKTTIGELDRLVASLTTKLSHLFEPLDPLHPIQDVKSVSVTAMNKIVERHNGICANEDKEKEEARRRLELHYVSRSSHEFSRHERRIVIKQSKEAGCVDKVKRLNEDIVALETEIIEHRRPASELNVELTAYLGHSELQFEVSDTGYAVSRSGNPAEGLSDGEKSSIALLYFLKTLEHKDFDKEKGVVVLDDPVSSLDAQSLYMAMGFVKDRLKDVGQLIVLTHNWGCFRFVKDWFDAENRIARRDRRDQPCGFYMLDCRSANQRRRGALKRLDPLLDRYKTEYHFLFARVHEVATGDSDGGLTEYVAMPNLARRLLEAFFAFASPGSEGDFASTLGNCEFEPAKKTAIQRFLNLESHGDGMGESRRDLSQLAQTPAIMEDILALIRSENEKHFDRMIGVVRRS